MKYKIICPITKKLKASLVGSGKISRRIIVRPFHRKKYKNKKDFFKNKQDFFREQVVGEVPKKSLSFKTSDAKIIFNYWNDSGFPFIHHKPIRSIVTSLAIEKINQALKRHDKDKIIKAIKSAHYLFNAGWFKYRLFLAKYKLSLPDFFSYTESKYKLATNKCPKTPKSWFKKSLKGNEHLEEEFSIILKDKHPQITNSLVTIWEEYNNFEKISNNDRNSIIIFSKRTVKFCELNNLDPSSIIDSVNNMLNKFKNYKPKFAGWLNNSIFWESKLPEELIRYGIFKSIREIKI